MNLHKHAVLSLFFGVAAGWAQQPNVEFHVQTKQSVFSPEEAIRAFEAPAVVAYTLEPGDELTVEVWGHTDLSGHHVIGPDGKVTVPIAGVLSLAGLTREEAEKAIAELLGRYYTDLSVRLRIDRYVSFHIYVLGRVANPGALQFESQPTLLDVVTRAGALPIGGSGAEKAGLGRCAVIRGRDKMIWIDLRSLLSQGNLSLNIRLARNDLVYIPDAGDQLVYVLGEVQHPGAFRLTPDMSFLDAFTQAGGLNEDANAEKISIVRAVSGAERQFSIKELLADRRELNFSLNEGDVIYVPERGMAKFGYVLQRVSPLTGLGIIGSLVK